jgi:hypothetical protein
VSLATFDKNYIGIYIYRINSRYNLAKKYMASASPVAMPHILLTDK